MQLSEERKVDFVIAGTQKAGTTALYEYLKDHDHICMANQKEVHYFDNDNYFERAPDNYDLYHSYFSPFKFHKVLGEATPIYMYWHDAPKRIWQYNNDMKVIVILRNPIERAYSHWNMERIRGNESLSFWDAIRFERERCREALPSQHRIYSYIDRGFYLEQLRRLWLYFSKEQVIVFRSEDLLIDPLSVLNKIFKFLAIEPLAAIDKKKIFSLKYEESMSDQEKEVLKNIFEYEIKALERVLSWDCNNWLSF